nr:uncharacterized protein LOC128686060 [Cherax quadricarinatus]XP_053628681.1 uncharacterized protein LOC128686060 [Cherax quadricarinatus]
MTRTTFNITTVYSSAQCVLSVVGSVGVILLFAGIPQLIYSPVVSVANLMTFLLGAILITTMVAGNSFLNYKYRRFEREARERRRALRDSAAVEGGSTGDPEDKPPSYDAILTSDGLPPDYYSILSEKPPKYEEIANRIITTTTVADASSNSSDTDSNNSIAIISGASPSTEVTSFSSVGVESLPQVFHSKTVTNDDELNSFAQVTSNNIDEREATRQGEINQETSSETRQEALGEISQETLGDVHPEVLSETQEALGIRQETGESHQEILGETDQERQDERIKETSQKRDGRRSGTDNNSISRQSSQGSLQTISES